MEAVCRDPVRWPDGGELNTFASESSRLLAAHVQYFRHCPLVQVYMYNHTPCHFFRSGIADLPGPCEWEEAITPSGGCEVVILRLSLSAPPLRLSALWLILILPAASFLPAFLPTNQAYPLIQVPTPLDTHLRPACLPSV